MAAPTATSADVARLLLERVGDPGGDFTATTHPTQAQVNGLIAQIVVEVQAVVGIDVDASLASYATLTVATGAAAMVELAFTSDADREDSKYVRLQSRYRGNEWLVDPSKVGGMLGTLQRAQADLAAGSPLGVDEGRPWATLPDPVRDGTPMTTWAERY